MSPSLSMDTVTELDRICNLIEESDMDDYQSIRVISSRLYKLIISTYEEDSFRAKMNDVIITSVKKKLLVLFHEHLRTNTLTELSTWQDFIAHSFSAFKTFFQRALGPFILDTQDQFVSAYMKEDNHPFRLCESLLQQLFELNTPIVQYSISVAVTRYNEATKDYLLDNKSDTVSSYYHKCRTLLEDWFRCSDALRLGYKPSSFMNRKFVNHLPDAFGYGSVKCRDTFYAFFHRLYDVCYTHCAFFGETPTIESQKSIAVDICYHYNLYEHWSMVKRVLDDTTPQAAQMENPCWFYWPELQLAFCQRDDTECRKYFAEPPSCELSGLCRFHLFNIRSRQSLFRLYAINGVKQQAKDITALRNYYDFIVRVIQDYTADASFGYRLLFLVSKEIYTHYFDNDSATTNADNCGTRERKEHEYLLHLCTNARHDEKEWQWFIMLWTHIPNMDTFLQSYIESHLYPSIQTGKLNIKHEDEFFMRCMQKCNNNECSTQLQMFRTLLHEWHHRSLDQNSFVVNRSVWPSIQPHTTVKLHPQIQGILHTQTQTYNNAFEHRQVNWCLHTTRATVTFAPNHEPTAHRTTARIRASLYVINMLLWMHDYGPSCSVGEWMDKLFGTDKSTDHSLEVYQHVSDLVKQGVITTSDVLASHHAVDHCSTIRMSIVYDKTEMLRTLDASPIHVPLCNPRDTTNNTTIESATTVMVDRKSVMESTIVRVLKEHKIKMHVDELRNAIQQRIKSFCVEDDFFQKTVGSLEEREYLCYHDGRTFVEYMP